MIESPVLQEWFAERDIKTRKVIILEILQARFGPVPDDVSAAVRVIDDEARLKTVTAAASSCASLDEFRARLTPPQQPAAN